MFSGVVFKWEALNRVNGRGCGWQGLSLIEREGAVGKGRAYRLITHAY